MQTMTTRRCSALVSVTSLARHRLLLAVIAATSAWAAQSAEPQIMRLNIQPPKDYFREECFVLEVGNKLSFKLTTPHPIDFNLHYHQNDGQTTFPVKQVVKSQLSKQFVAQSAGVYCFNATNLEDQQDAYDVVLSYAIATQ